MDQPEARADADVLFEVIRSRRSMGLARLSPDPVDRHVLERMLAAADWAPSHEDTEPWRFGVYMGAGRERLADLFEAAFQQDIEAGKPVRDADPSIARRRAFAAPVWITIAVSPMLKDDGSMLMTEAEELMAVASAVQNLHLMAQAQGLAGMWHSKGLSVHPGVAAGLGIEPPDRLLGMFMCGWPSSDWLTSSRRPIEGKVSWFD